LAALAALAASAALGYVTQIEPNLFVLYWPR
jgi:hypothetical protein